MGFPVYDYRKDIKNVLVTSQIRSRFLKMEPGQSAQLHSHDLGHEIFLILEGRVEFEIDGETEELGPGQMCIALADQPHRVSVLGDEPMTMYLSVTPHIYPTHTPRNDEGERLPHNYAPPSAYDVEPDMQVSVSELLTRQIHAVKLLSELVEACVELHEKIGEQLISGTNEKVQLDGIDTRQYIWESLYPVFKCVSELGETWNQLAPRLSDSENN
ncbi:cupin domain-containing protein [Candidatus Poribacteria bacterium]|nr:cupin domain-containing protein [Candidatus Poribacteria bacterium]